METVTLEERIAELEKENQDLEERVEELEKGQFGKIATQQLVLRDPGGNARAILACPNENPGLLFLDNEGQVRLLMNLSEEGDPDVSLRDESGDVRADFYLREDGEPTLRLLDESGSSRAMLSLLRGQPDLTFGDQDGEPRATFGVEEDDPILRMLDSEEVRLVFELQNGSPVFFITDRNGDPIRGLKEDAVMGL